MSAAAPKAMRYRVGFPPGISSNVSERNPGYTLIVDTMTPFGFGVVVALVDGEKMAERIVRFLNGEASE
jgi:hypothetical protein